jgi:AcrR family transcriptional regulator
MKSKSKNLKRDYGGISSSERDTMRRESLVNAGLICFGEHGFAATTIEALCSDARISTRDFYSIFGSKEELLVAVYDRVIEDSTAEVVRAFSGLELNTPSEAAAAMRAALNAFAISMTGDEHRARVNFIVVVGVSPEVEQRRRKAIHNFAELIGAFIALLDERRLIKREVVSPVLCVALVGAVHETLTDWLIRPERPPLESVVDDLSALFEVALLDDPVADPV